MWKFTLALQFRKGFSFAHAIDNAGVPTDQFAEADRLWNRWDAIAATRGDISIAPRAQLAA